MFERSAEAIAYIRNNGIEMVDVKFSNLFGGWHHITMPAARVGERLLEEGEGFDGSSVPGFTRLEKGDMLLVPDLATAFIDPFCCVKTLSFLGTIMTTEESGVYVRDPRGILRRAEAYLASLGWATHSSWGPELEFYVFDSVQYENTVNAAWYAVDSDEAAWRAKERTGAGYAVPMGRGYHAAPPLDRLHDLRTEMVKIIGELGIPVRYHHHEVGGPGQCEIEPAMGPALKLADAVQIIKYVVKMVAVRHGKSATFMPKPLYAEAGNGLHFHLTTCKGDEPVFYDAQGYAGLSPLALSFIAGILDHGPSLLGLCNPSTNSYKRLVPGYEAPINLFFSLGNRSAAVRIPAYAKQPREKRCEFRPPDATCNPYLAMAAILLAGIDGVARKLDPTACGFGPIDENIFEWPEEKRRTVRPLPTSLEDALRALEADHDYLLRGGVFTPDLLETWIARKRRELVEVQRRPHPYEVELYYAI
jgi:glutamine synthetase